MSHTDGPSPGGSVWLVGVQLDPDREIGPELYTLLFEAKHEQPCVSGGRIVLFTMPELAGLASQMEDDPRARGGLAAPNDVYTVYGLGRALALIRNHEATQDEESSIVDCLNLLFDCIAALGLTLPAEYGEPLRRLADHLTFSNSLSEFDAIEPGWREPALNGFLWCLRAAGAKSIVLTAAALNAAGTGQP